MRQCINAKNPLSARSLFKKKIVRSQATALSVMDSIRKVMGTVPGRPLYGAVCIDVVRIDRLARIKTVSQKIELPSVIIAVHRNNNLAVAVALQLSSADHIADNIRTLVQRRVAAGSTLDIRSEYGRLDFGNHLKRVSVVSASPESVDGPMSVCNDVIGRLRSGLMDVHRRPVTAAQVVPYLHEFEFRFNECRTDKDKRRAFTKLISAAVPKFGADDYQDLDHPNEVRI
jgi:hypothetical protein